MRSILDQLDTPDSMLLMYLSDELPAGDRRTLEQRLADDPSLRAQLERLREAQHAAEGIMRELDANHPLPGSEAAALRKVGRSLRQWQADRAAAAVAPRRGARAPLRFPWWTYPLTAAAAVTLAFSAWWYNFADNTPALVEKPDEPAEVLLANGDSIQYLASLDDPHDFSGLEQDLQAVQTLRDMLQ